MRAFLGIKEEELPKWLNSRLTVVSYVNSMLPGWFFLVVLYFLVGGLKVSLVAKRWVFSSSNIAPLVWSNIVHVGVDWVL